MDEGSIEKYITTAKIYPSRYQSGSNFLVLTSDTAPYPSSEDLISSRIISVVR